MKKWSAVICAVYFVCSVYPGVGSAGMFLAPPSAQIMSIPARNPLAAKITKKTCIYDVSEWDADGIDFMMSPFGTVIVYKDRHGFLCMYEFRFGNHKSLKLHYDHESIFRPNISDTGVNYTVNTYSGKSDAYGRTDFSTSRYSYVITQDGIVQDGIAQDERKDLSDGKQKPIKKRAEMNNGDKVVYYEIPDHNASLVIIKKSLYFLQTSFDEMLNEPTLGYLIKKYSWAGLDMICDFQEAIVKKNLSPEIMLDNINYFVNVCIPSNQEMFNITPGEFEKMASDDSLVAFISNGTLAEVKVSLTALYNAKAMSLQADDTVRDLISDM